MCERAGGHHGAETHDHDVGRFDRWGAHYDRSVFQPLFFDRVHRLMLEALSPTPGELIIDIGCGTGKLALRIAAGRVGRVTGVDPAPKMVQQAGEKREGLRASFVVGMAEELPLATDSFDAAVSAISAHHWREPARGFAEMARVLRPGGRVVVADAGVLGPVVGFLKTLRRVDPDHHPGWDAEDLGGLLYGAGFHQVRVRTRKMLGGTVLLLTARR